MLGSASAQWAVTAPIFVPMLMLLGYSPEVIQAAYRIGDSSTNIITPMMSYFGLIMAFVAKYEPKAGVGTLIAMMLPYCGVPGALVLVLLPVDICVRPAGRAGVADLLQRWLTGRELAQADSSYPNTTKSCDRRTRCARRVSANGANQSKADMKSNTGSISIHASRGRTAAMPSVPISCAVRR